MANKLYATDTGDEHSTMRQTNAVHAIGHIACELKDFDEITNSALTILQQRFHHPASQLDERIIEQFANILLTGVVSIFEQFF